MSSDILSLEIHRRIHEWVKSLLDCCSFDVINWRPVLGFGIQKAVWQNL